MEYLAIDIGGTKTRIARLRVEKAGATILSDHFFASREIDTLYSVLKEGDLEGVRAIGIGIAGPVKDNAAQLTNLTWGVDGNAMAKRYGRPVLLMNDMVAHTYGIIGSHREHQCLHAGQDTPGTLAVMGVGTGLGECLAVWDGAQHIPSPTEGGHVDFSPMTEEDLELWQFLKGRYEHVSWERVVSGSDGLNNLTRFHLQQKTPGFDGWGALDLDQPVAAQMNDAARTGDLFAKTVMQHFIRLLGCELGNLALKSLATGGLYLTGGVAPKIKAWFADPVFMRGYLSKGRFSELLQQIPLYLVEDQDLAIKGAAFAAARG